MLILMVKATSFYLQIWKVIKLLNFTQNKKNQKNSHQKKYKNMCFSSRFAYVYNISAT